MSQQEDPANCVVPTNTRDHGMSMGDHSGRLTRSSGVGGRRSRPATDVAQRVRHEREHLDRTCRTSPELRFAAVPAPLGTWASVHWTERKEQPVQANSRRTFLKLSKQLKTRPKSRPKLSQIREHKQATSFLNRPYLCVFAITIIDFHSRLCPFHRSLHPRHQIIVFTEAR